MNKKKKDKKFNGLQIGKIYCIKGLFRERLMYVGTNKYTGGLLFKPLSNTVFSIFDDYDDDTKGLVGFTNDMINDFIQVFE